MKMSERKIPYASRKTQIALATKLAVGFDDLSQEWEWEIAKPELVVPAVALYVVAKSDEERWSLMQIIIQSFHDAQIEDPPLNLEDFRPFWATTLSYLRSDYEIHWDTIRYWAKFSELENKPIPMVSDLRSLQTTLGHSE